MRIKRNIKLFLYRLKDQKIYYMIPLFYIFSVAGLAWFSFYHHKRYFPRDEIYKLLNVFAPFFSLFWVLPIVCERTDEKWGEFFISCRTDTVWRVIIHNIIFDLIMLPAFCLFSGVYGNMLNIYLQMAVTCVFVQCIGITALYLSSSAFSAYGIPFLYFCLTMFSLLDSEMNSALSYVPYEEMSMQEYAAVYCWKMIAVFLMTFYSVIRTRM